MAFLSTDPGIDPNQLAIQPNDWFNQNAPTDSTQPGSGIPWAAGATQPSSSPPGYHWDANMASFVKDTAPAQSAQDFITQYQQSHPASEGIGPLTDALKAAGYSNVSSYMYGSTPSGNELSIDGQKFKVLGAENSPGAYWYTGGNDSSGGGGGNGYGSYSGAAPNLYASNPNAPPTPTPMSPYVAPTWSGGAAPTPTPLAQYSPPTLAQLQATPGYQARLAAGMQVQQRSAAAQGTILNGGTQQALQRYGQDYASNEYNNLVNQGMAATSLNNTSTQTGNQNAYQTYLANYGQFMDSANLGLQARTQNVGEQQQNYQNQYAAYLNANSQTLSDYLTNFNTQRTSMNDYWSHLNDLYSTGAQTANNSYKPGVTTP